MTRFSLLSLFYVLMIACAGTSTVALAANTATPHQATPHPGKPVTHTIRAIPQLRITPAEQWKAMPIGDRRALIAAWEKLDETTRPAFPVYRDTALEAADKPEGSLTGNK